MKINLIANNNKPVTAESGGGIDSRFSNIPALIANRDKAGIWEELHLIENPSGSVYLVTYNGDYVTAENGGGSTLSTNRTVPGAWETFYRRDGGFLCFDLKHYITCEIGSNLTLNATRTVKGPWETFTIKNLEGMESGSLFKYGQFLYRNSNNTVFDWRGCSMFLVPTRYFRGENIQPQIDWMLKYEFNVARMFVGGVNWTGWDDKLYQNPSYQQQLGGLIGLFNQSGIRVEATVVTYQDLFNVWNRVISQVNELIQQYPMNFLEIMNEPWSIWSNDAPVLLTAGMQFKGLTAYGIQQSNAQGQYATRDYVTAHLPRDQRYFRNTKDLYEMRVGSEFYVAKQMPIVGDEPVGVIDPAYYPNYKQSGEFWVDQYGRGARVTNTNKIASAFAIARLFSLGNTYHFQAGLEGRIPTNSELIQEDGARLINEVCKFIPAEAQTGTYTRPGLGDFPVVFNPGDADHPYASVLDGKTAYLVMTNASTSWIPTPVNGWKVEKIHPELNWLVKLVK